MPSNDQRKSWWLLLLCIFVAGILFGYYLIPHKPTPPPKHINTLAFNILPGGVQAAPNTGDKVEWYRDGQHSEDVHIHFYGESPCAESGDGHTCTITAARGQFMYFCSDKADPSDPTAKILCLDPGIDPGSGCCSNLELPGKKDVVYAAQKPPSPKPVEAVPTVQVAPTNLTVVCKNNTVQVLNPSTTPPNSNPPTVKVGGLVQWNSTLDPTIKMDPNYCAGSTLGDKPPSCTVKSAGDIPYTIEVSRDKCANPAPAPFHINVRNLIKNCDF